MTDVPDGSGPMPRRSPRVSDGGAPVSGALAMVLAAVAVIAGFFILKSISSDGEQNADFPDSGISTSGDGTSDSGDGVTATSTPVATLAPTTTVPAIVTAGAIVLVANANTVGGSATAMTRALETGPGFTMASPVNASAGVGDIETTVIYYDAAVPEAQVVAESLARVLGGVASVAPVGETPPTADGTLGEASVLLMLGNDKAGKTLAELAPEVQAPATQITSPPVAGTPGTTAPPG